jgi:hypothetical protein
VRARLDGRVGVAFRRMDFAAERIDFDRGVALVVGESHPGALPHRRERQSASAPEGGDDAGDALRLLRGNGHVVDHTDAPSN